MNKRMLGMENGEGYGVIDIVFNLGSVSFFLFFVLLQFMTTTITRVFENIIQNFR